MRGPNEVFLTEKFVNFTNFLSQIAIDEGHKQFVNQLKLMPIDNFATFCIIQLKNWQGNLDEFIKLYGDSLGIDKNTISPEHLDKIKRYLNLFIDWAIENNRIPK